MRATRRVTPWWLAALSALLLVGAYPPCDWGWLAWVTLVPLLLAIEEQSPRRAFAIAYVAGLLYFLGLLSWLLYVSAIGWVLLAAYLALFVGLFGWFVGFLTPHVSPRASLVLVPAAWVALEWARSHLLTGFGCGLLGYTQWRWLPVIQIADIVGAYGVSFLVVLVNVALWRGWRARRQPQPLIALPLVVGGVLAVTVAYGIWRLRMPIAGEAIRVAVVQGNIPQSRKWDAAWRDEILQQYMRLTARAVATDRPSLIVWPETSVPGLLGIDETVTNALVRLVAQVRVPCVVGAPTERVLATGLALYNSAVLVTPDGGLEARYDKLHLVPYGEFLPFERSLPWLRHLLPPLGDFSPGREATVFTIEGQETGDKRQVIVGSALRFSTLICFEDVFPSLARRFVRDGARLLAVITNDAWFGPTGAAAQHAQASVFRAIENRVSVVRAANTGLSCLIDPRGRLTASVQDNGGRRLFVAGSLTQPVLIPASAETIYNRCGDWFAVACVLLVLGGCCRPRRSPRPAPRQRR